MLDELLKKPKLSQPEALHQFLELVRERRNLNNREEALFYLLRLGLRHYIPQTAKEYDLYQTLKAGEFFDRPLPKQTPHKIQIPEKATLQKHPPHLTRVRFVRMNDLQHINGAKCASVPMPYFVVPARIPVPMREDALSSLKYGQKLFDVARDLNERLNVDFDPLQAIYWQFDVRLWAIGFQASNLVEAGPVLKTYHEADHARWFYRITDNFVELYNMLTFQRVAVVDRYMTLEKEQEFTKAEKIVYRNKNRLSKRESKSELKRLEIAWQAPISPDPELFETLPEES